MKENNDKGKIISRNKRNNAKLYPVYKMFSWDLLCYYSIEFLFLTITKGLTASGVLIVFACFVFSKVLMQIPSVTIADMLGKRKGIIIGNTLVALYILLLMIAPNIGVIMLAQLLCALGYDIKIISETNLLYDSVSTKGGEGLYTKLDSQGLSWYFWLDGIVCLAAGYLFVINNYLPMIVCLSFLIVSTVLSFRFKDIYSAKKHEKSIGRVLKEYKVDLKKSFKFITKSKRMRSYIIFGAIFYGAVRTNVILRNALLVSKGIPEEQYAIILAVLTLLAGIAATLSKGIQRKFKNRALTFISLMFCGACIIISIVINTLPNTYSIPIIVLMFAITRMVGAVWATLEYKYLKNFSTELTRNKIMFTYEVINCLVTCIMALGGSLLLKYIGIDTSLVIFSLIVLLGIVLSLDYMRTRFGLKPKEYSKQDIDMSELLKKK